MYVHDLRDADARCGGKAVGLARLVGAGLRVPDGFAIDDRAFRLVIGDADGELVALGHAFAEAEARVAHAAVPAELERAVRLRAAALGPLLAVRSSASIEDGERGGAAGVFVSRVAVPVADVWLAIRAVWASALAPLAAAYARDRGRAIAIGVVVQRFVAGGRVVAYTRPPGQPERDEVLVQRGDVLARHPRGAPEVADLLVAEHAIGAAATGADVELIEVSVDDGARWIVQARPIVHAPARRARVAPPPAVLAVLDDGRAWTWDVAHNPDPMSTAQVGLVERVERDGAAPWSLRTCGGYLYSARPGVARAVSREVADAGALASEAARLEAELVRALGAPATLADAIASYVAFYRIWAGALSPLVAAARDVLPAALRARGIDDDGATVAALVGRVPTVVEATLAAAARGELADREVERRLGALAPAWDVAVPTFGERAGVLAAAIARVATLERRAAIDAPVERHPLADELDREVAIARVAAELADRDDVLFARAQHVVRQALLARARELALDGDDIFWIALPDAIAGLPPLEAHRRAAGTRAAAARAADWDMPIVVGAASSSPTRVALHGVGSGARVVGRVVRFASLATAIAVGRGDVVVTRAVTPALAIVVAGCAALVSETGGLLDHGAALARELGITCVVGCRDAWTQLCDGELVSVDGARGEVARYASSS